MRKLRLRDMSEFIQSPRITAWQSPHTSWCAHLTVVSVSIVPLATWDPRHRVTFLATNTEALRAQQHISGFIRDLKIVPMWQHYLNGFGKTSLNQKTQRFLVQG